GCETLGGFVEVLPRIRCRGLSDCVSFLGSRRIRVEELSRIAFGVPGCILREDRSAGAFVFVERIRVATPPGGGRASDSRRDELSQRNKISEFAVHVFV